MRDQHNNVSPAVLLTPGVYSATTTPVTADLLGFNSAEVVVEVAVGGITFSGTNRIDISLQHSDDNSTYTNVTTADMLGVTVSSGIIKSLTSAHAAATVDRYGYVGSKRYLQLTATFGGTHGTGTGLSSVVVRGHPVTQPTP